MKSETYQNAQANANEHTEVLGEGLANHVGIRFRESRKR